MGEIKIENCDPKSSAPLVFDVMSADEFVTEPVATHVLTFGQFVIVQAVDGLKTVSAEEYAERQAEAAEAKAEAEAAATGSEAQTLSAARVDFAEPEAKLKRRDLEELTKDELVAYADNHDIEVSSHWTKADIVDAIVKG